MKIPTPSFFRIRLVICIVIFFVFCFLVGLTKNVFAQAYPGECTVTLYSWNNDPDTGGWGYSNWWADSSGIIKRSGWSYDQNQIIDGIHVAHYYWDDDALEWKQKDYLPGASIKEGTTVDGGVLAPLGNMEAALDPNGCPDCTDEELEAIEECGEDNYELDPNTCDWVCTDCQDPGEETYDEALNRCQMEEKNLTYYDQEQCRGICGNCTEEDYLAVKEKCGKLNFSFSEVTCDGECDGNCLEKLEGQAAQDCGPDENFLGFTCGATPEKGYFIKDVYCEQKIYPKPTDPGTDKPDDPEPPTPTPPAADPDDPNDNNQWNAAIKKNLDKQIQQNDKQIAELKKQTTLQKWIGENQKTTADNTAKIGEILQDGVKVKLGKEAEDALDDISDGIQELDNELETINSGSFTAPVEEPAYVADEHDFGTRTTQFLDEMKSTSLFSIPNTLSNSIPGGGSSTLVIHGGQTYGGDHTIDFNWLSAGLTTLKYLFQIAGMVMAILIVTIKKN